MYNIGAVFRVVLMGTMNATIELRPTFQMQLTEAAGALPFADIVDDFGEIMDSFAADLTNDITEAVTYTSYSVATLNSSEVSGAVALTAPQTGDVSIATSQPLPSQTQLVMNFPTGHSRRRLLKYVPGLTEASTGDGGNFFSTVTDAWATVGLGWIALQEATNGGYRYMHATDDPTLDPQQVFPVGCLVSRVPKVLKGRRN